MLTGGSDGKARTLIFHVKRNDSLEGALERACPGAELVWGAPKP